MNVFSTLKNMNILLIDDDEWIRDSMRVFFETEGCRLTSVETAEEALEMVHRQDFDLVICDYKLPGLSGLTFLKELRQVQAQALTILITAYKTDELVSEAKKIGVHAFIAKPFNSETIEASLSHLIARQNRAISNMI
ncbi:MAG: response regulator [Deltaproteobacteria bacterium]|jgi:DNA-binding NtrC family response regulator|nr:response regulator [Deltaproteobacteria bacterium]